jgi:hypothetical protein
MKYNNKDKLQDHVLATAGGIQNVAMLFSAQFPESSVQYSLRIYSILSWARILNYFKVTAEKIALGEVNFSNGIL